MCSARSHISNLGEYIPKAKKQRRLKVDKENVYNGNDHTFTIALASRPVIITFVLLLILHSVLPDLQLEPSTLWMFIRRASMGNKLHGPEKNIGGTEFFLILY